MTTISILNAGTLLRSGPSRSVVYADFGATPADVLARNADRLVMQLCDAGCGAAATNVENGLRAHFHRLHAVLMQTEWLAGALMRLPHDRVVCHGARHLPAMAGMGLDQNFATMSFAALTTMTVQHALVHGWQEPSATDQSQISDLYLSGLESFELPLELMLRGLLAAARA
jgi:hypothetical protein